jgi:hypothetical protein
MTSHYTPEESEREYPHAKDAKDAKECEGKRKPQRHGDTKCFKGRKRSAEERHVFSRTDTNGF